MRMKIYQKAVVKVSSNDRQTLETLLTRKDDEGNLVEEPPPFPLRDALVAFNGNSATVSVAEPGRRNRRVCRLTDATLTLPRSDKGAVLISGKLPQAKGMRLTEEDSLITLEIASYASCTTC